MLAGALLFLLTPRGRLQWKRPGFWLAMAIAALGLVPLLISNWQQHGAGVAFQLIERTDRIKTYLELSDRFITPMATRLCPELGQYHADLIKHMTAIGCDHALKARYDTFLAENS